MSATTQPERIQTIIIGAGQAGLSVGYYLQRQGLPFTILEANDRVGDSWRKRWDSLRLFTPARFDSLAGLPFPANKFAFPTKDEMADYLEGYAKHFHLPVRTGVRVERLTRRGDRFLLETNRGEIEAENVVVAMANFQKARVPEFAARLSPEIVQLHSSEYRNPAQLKPGAVLLVGAGNSGAEIALDVARSGHKTWVSGRDTGSVPFRGDSFVGSRVLLPLLLRVVFHRVLTLKTPMGRKARPNGSPPATPLIRVKAEHLTAAGVERTPRVAGVHAGQPVLDDGRSLDVANVIWCTGFEPGFAWLDLPVFSESGQPVHDRGVVASQPGLYFTGLHFLFAMSSTMIHGAARDAAYIATAISNSLKAGKRAGERGPAPELRVSRAPGAVLMKGP